MNQDNVHYSSRRLGSEAKIPPETYYKNQSRDSETPRQMDAVFKRLFKYFATIQDSENRAVAIVQDHKGYIDVASDGGGTKFELSFPIIRDEMPVKDLPGSLEDYKGAGETILVVDDIESQREITCNIPDVLGYTSKAVSSGEEAVEYLKEHKVDLILLDMIMDPGINGRETYERIIKIHPAQKAIMVSGFAETDDVKAAQRLGVGRYIKKPLTL